MLNYEILDEIYAKFKKRCETYLTDVICTSQKFTCGRLEKSFIFLPTMKCLVMHLLFF